MLSALDIQNKEFSKGLRGYNEEEVDVFLDEIIVDYQSLLDTNAALNQQIEELNAKLSEYKSSEGAVIKTLESAKSIMNDISKSAEKRAEMLLKNAEMEAANKIMQADQDVKRLSSEKEKLESVVYSLKLRMKNILESELSRIDIIDKDVLGE